jgi:hypothetical protein
MGCALFPVLDHSASPRVRREQAAPPPDPNSAGPPDLAKTPLRDLGLTIAGTPLEAVVNDFRAELHAAGITHVRPHFYLSTEWGVPFGTVSIAIPFYLARPDLTRLHAERGGLVEGATPPAVLRYLRHEMGHVVNYAYRLYERPEWAKLFGDINRPYEEEYRPRPFSRDYVEHLPGWYAQKHTDEDWAETFAVWMTPSLDWRSRYAGWPALKKLEYCDRTMAELRARPPLAAEEDPDEDVGGLALTLDEFYHAEAGEGAEPPVDADAALDAVFEHAGRPPDARPAAELIGRVEHAIGAEVFRWTGYFPERTRRLLRRLAERARQRGLTYAADEEASAAVALASYATAYALHRMQDGAFAG